jgi:hypothetical protein
LGCLLGLALVGDVVLVVNNSVIRRPALLTPEPVQPVHRYTRPGDSWVAQLPDGRYILATYVVDYPGQSMYRWEDLPWTGNKIGDARYVYASKHWFLWLKPNPALTPIWIDP